MLAPGHDSRPPRRRAAASTSFDEYWAAQLNDTHPSIAIAELMRLLVDEHGMDWEQAWAITQRTCAYTNHTLLAEALEKWPLPLFGASCCRATWRSSTRSTAGSWTRSATQHPGDEALLRRVSLIDETGERYVRMANLATVGSHAVNGVAALHTELLKATVLGDFHASAPHKFFNITNGVTPRRWLALEQSEPERADHQPHRRRLARRSRARARRSSSRLPTTPAFRADVARASRPTTSARSPASSRHRTGIAVDPQSLFDIQVKRLHEYKRQHLNAPVSRHAVQPLQAGRRRTGRRHERSSSAARRRPGYRMAKLMIKLITRRRRRRQSAIPDVSELLKVVFLPDFNVKLGQQVYPAAELSEQISTAGKEAPAPAT